MNIFFRGCAGLALAVSATSAAYADTGIPDEVQSFFVNYAEHGSSGPQPFYLYSGPLHLSSVKVVWAASISTGYFDPYGYDDGTRFPLTYDGQVGFWTDIGPSDSKTFWGTAECSPLGCGDDGQADGIAYFGPEGFLGTGMATIDCFCSISPNFYGAGGVSGFSSYVYGTITYSFSAAPEPASWALMLGGFGLVGNALRNRRKAAIAYAKAPSRS